MIILGRVITAPNKKCDNASLEILNHFQPLFNFLLLNLVESIDEIWLAEDWI